MIIREVTLPLRLVSLTNQREHWAKKATRARMQRGVAKLALEGIKHRAWPGTQLFIARGEGVVVALTRVAPRALDDDNLRAAAKSVRDGVADWLGIDDGDERIEWLYAQERGKPREYAVRIRIERKSA